MRNLTEFGCYVPQRATRADAGADAPFKGSRDLCDRSLQQALSLVMITLDGRNDQVTVGNASTAGAAAALSGTLSSAEREISAASVHKAHGARKEHSLLHAERVREKESHSEQLRVSRATMGGHLALTFELNDPRTGWRRWQRRDAADSAATATAAGGERELSARMESMQRTLDSTGWQALLTLVVLLSIANSVIKATLDTRLEEELEAEGQLTRCVFVWPTARLPRCTWPCH